MDKVDSISERVQWEGEKEGRKQERKEAGGREERSEGEKKGRKREREGREKEGEQGGERAESALGAQSRPQVLTPLDMETGVPRPLSPICPRTATWPHGQGRGLAQSVPAARSPGLHPTLLLSPAPVLPQEGNLAPQYCKGNE